MSSLIDKYQREMDGIRLSEDAKGRMRKVLKERAMEMRREKAGNRQAEIIEMRTRDEEDGKEGSRKAEAKTGDTMGNATRRVRRHGSMHSVLTRAAAVLAVALVATGGGTLAYAGGNPEVALGYARDLFTGAPANTEVVDAVGYPIGASAESGGVRVTAEAVYGDRYNYRIVYKVKRTDGQPFDVKPYQGDSKLLPLGFAGPSGTTIDGVGSLGGGSWFYDADPDDAAIQYVEDMTTSTDEKGGIVGRTVRVHLGDLTEYGADDADGKVIAKGSWDLKFKMGYEDESVEVKGLQGAQMTHMGKDVAIRSVLVSPVGITVLYDIDGQIRMTGGSGEMSNHDRQAQDAVMGVPVKVRFKDGTEEDFSSSGASASENSDGTSTVRKGECFDRILKVEDIESVTVGDRTVEMK